MQLVSKITLATFDFNKHLTIKELSHVTSYNTLKVINFASKFRNFSKNTKQNFHWISIFLLLINVIVIKYVTETLILSPWVEMCDIQVSISYFDQILTHFRPMFHFYTPWKHQKTGGFLMFSGGIEMEHWLKMG